jgi:hypothetical protein
MCRNKTEGTLQNDCGYSLTAFGEEIVKNPNEVKTIPQCGSTFRISA